MSSAPASETRLATILIVDIADTVSLRSRIGDADAERRIRGLLDGIIELARARGGHFIKSYGDDVLAAFDGVAIGAAAETAIDAQRAASAAGLQLYAGLHAGPVEFRETMGHPDAVGLTVSIAARLHKLTEGVPGRIHLLDSAVEQLPDPMRSRASLFAIRQLKGIGAARVWILEWREQPTMQATRLVTTAPSQGALRELRIRYGDRALAFSDHDAALTLGRSRECVLPLDDLELRISSIHVLIEHVDSRWFVKDISRNGTWLHDSTSDAGCQLPQAIRVELPERGLLCLGRSFADDPAKRHQIEFELSATDPT